jgi:hypothetical protein
MKFSGNSLEKKKCCMSITIKFNLRIKEMKSCSDSEAEARTFMHETDD